MAALFEYKFDCGYVAKVKGNSGAVNHADIDRYYNIYIKPKAKSMHNDNCDKCKSNA